MKMVILKDALLEEVRASRTFVPGGLEPTFAIGTYKTLQKVLHEGAKVLALTGHTTSDGKHFLQEDDIGAASEFNPAEMLPAMG